MFRIEIPNRAVYEEIRARLDGDPAAIELFSARRKAVRRRSAVWFAFTLDVAMGWFLRF